MVFDALEIPVKGVFDGLEGFEGISEEVDVEASGGGAVNQAVDGTGEAQGGGGGGGALGALAGVAEGAGMMKGKLGSAGASAGASAGSGGAMAGMAGSLTAILGGVLAIVGILLMLEPIQAYLGMIFSFLEAVIFPFIMPFMIIIGLWMRLIPMIMDFVSDPASALQSLGNFIIDGLMKGLDLLNDLFDGMLGDLVSRIGGFFSPVTGWLGDIHSTLNNIFGSDGKNGATDMGLESTTGFNPEDTRAENAGSVIGGLLVPGPGGKSLGEKAGQLVVNIEGDDVEVKGGTERQINKYLNQKESNKNFFYSLANSLFG